MKTFGLFGLGSIGKRHKTNLEALGHKVIGYDPVHQDENPDAQDIYKKSDAIIIASPTETHISIMEHAIIHQKPFFVEKPISDDNPDRVRDVLTRASGLNLPIMVGNILRFHSCVPVVKQWIEEAESPPLWAQFTVAQFSNKHPYLRDGVLLNWGAHELDLALHLLGPAKVVASSMYSHWQVSDDISDVVLHHFHGARTSVHMDYITNPEIREFRIVGEDWRIECDLVTRAAGQTGAKDKHFQGKDTWDQNYVNEMQAFIDRIGGKDAPGASGEDGLAVLELIEEARKEAK